MIPRSRVPLYDHSWQWHLRNAFRTAGDLIDALGLPPDTVAVDSEFPLLATRPFVARMEQGNPRDPLLLQILPQARESDEVAGYTGDPLDERSHAEGAGIIHKYHGRVLLVTTGACAVNCRYCFRRHFPYDEARLTTRQWDFMLDYIRRDSAIREVILSGGDPLIMTDDQLSELVHGLESLDQLTHLRIHTRLPVVLPQRVTSGLLELFAGSRLKVIVVIHTNHSRELDDQVASGLGRLAAAGALLLNQSVLLKDVNNNADALCELSWQLSMAGVVPYYLHMLDKVAGAAHFEVSRTGALRLIDEVRDRMPGYLVPRLVSEIPGHPAKQEIR
ncbi:MAG: EF-P beta-lysylation protein EpmB [Proteobacteria bacterium]|nr:EF-P beta-lysylation protein EpmB [Pseudomonadota bacterium]MDA1301287.1 EF-P beta-lysylation protein EpmB [Pseudomonadota bacterium]